MYETFLRPILFNLDPEDAHNLALSIGGLARYAPLQRLLSSIWGVADPRLVVDAFGLRFPNPIGLAAGMDKKGDALYGFDAMGFGAIELGTITARPQSGNPRPRIFRYRSDRALINRMGFPSGGAVAAESRLATVNRQRLRAVLGINLGKTKLVPLDEALQDYLFSFKTLYAHADYFVINVSSPNTPELRKLQERGRLEEIITGIRDANPQSKPILVKVAPDLSLAELDQIVDLALAQNLSGIIATNTTLSRDGLTQASAESGGLSGRPLYHRSKDFVRHIYEESHGALPIIGVGGISSAEEVLSMMRAGACLVQIYTALIYGGPSLVGRILRDLLGYCQRDGLKNISEIVGCLK